MNTNGTSKKDAMFSGNPLILFLNFLRWLAFLPGKSKWAMWSCLALSVLVFALAMVPSVHFIWWNQPELFWDAHVYDRAIASFAIGEHPNANAPEGFPFVYLPTTLIVFKYLFATPFGLYLIPILTFGLVFSVGMYVSPLRATISGISVWSAAFFYGFYASLTGNITLILHLISILYFLSYADSEASHTNIRGSFLIGITAAIKPYMLGSLVLFWFDKKAPVHQKALQTAIVIAIVIIIYGVSYLLLPELTRDYVDLILSRTANTYDLGTGFFRIFYDLGLSRWHALFAHAAVALSLLALYYVRNKSSGKWSVSLLYLLIVLMNPRLKPYDYMPALLPLVVLSAQNNGKLFKFAFWASAITAVVFAKIILEAS